MLLGLGVDKYKGPAGPYKIDYPKAAKAAK
jgi:hypothetical protein